MDPEASARRKRKGTTGSTFFNRWSAMSRNEKKRWDQNSKPSGGGSGGGSSGRGGRKPRREQRWRRLGQRCGRQAGSIKSTRTHSSTLHFCLASYLPFLACPHAHYTHTAMCVRGITKLDRKSKVTAARATPRQRQPKQATRAAAAAAEAGTAAIRRRSDRS